MRERLNDGLATMAYLVIIVTAVTMLYLGSPQ